jgi:FkbM family methyltransferase
MTGSMDSKRLVSRYLYYIKDKLSETPLRRIPGLGYVYDIFYKYTTPDDKTWVNVSGYDIKIDINDDIGRRIYHDNHESEIVDMLSELVGLGDKIIDVGGHYGYYTAIFRGLVGHTGEVIVVEPNPKNAELLRDTIRANDWKNVEIIEKAVSESEGEIILNSVKNGEGRSFVEGAHGRSSISDRADTEFKVETIGLSSLIEQRGIKMVDLIKIDIEGAEIGALRSLSGKFDLLSTMIIEIHSNQPKDIYDEMYDILSSSPGTLSYIDCDDEVSPDTLSTTSANLLWQSK